ncbi:MAG TPA: magnesium and cobalt transport protein CorA [Burkholderiaceae bacterium]|nr:magnesium and cobalt transport protein CorA [Burkholderiaceae bacterium]
MAEFEQPSAVPEKAVIASVLYRTGQPPVDVPLEQVHRPSDEPRQLLWVGLREPELETLRLMGERLGLGARAIEEITERHVRPKILEFEHMTLVVAVTIEVENLRPVFGETQLLIGRNFLITVRRGAVAAHNSLRQYLEGVPELLGRGSDYVASMLLDLLADRYLAALTKFEATVEAIEQQFMLRGFGDVDVRKLYRLRRDLLRMHTAIFPMTEICRRLARVDTGHIDANCRGYFGEVADRVQRIDELINSLREALAFAFEAGSMLGQSQQTDITKKLAAWAAILAVPTAVAGIYGMNFVSMPELKWHYGYPLMMGCTAVACAILYWRFRKARWL